MCSSVSTLWNTYDAGGRVITRIDALGQRLAYGYDRLGRLVRLTDANDAAYTFRYDPAGQLAEETEFDGKTRRYRYDEASGRLASIEEAGRTTELGQDRAGRISRRSCGEEAEQYGYDASGRLVEASNRYSRIQRFFDPVGNLVREHHAYDVFGVKRSFVWHHGYDELGNRIRTVRPDGHVVDWLRYGSGHVHGLLVDGEEQLQLERDELHREVKRTLSSRILQLTAYDPAGRLARQTVQRHQAPGALSARRYHYDAAGQLTQIEDNRRGALDYRYDPVGRLIEAIGPGRRERFAFDPASNIVDPGRPETARTPGGSAGRRETTLPDSVPRVLGNLLREYAGTHFEYDVQGNLIEKRSPAGVQRFEWDGFDRMRAAHVAEQSRQAAATYFYDAFGRRIAKEVNGARTVYGWDGDTLAYESADEHSTHYLYELETFVPMAQYAGAPVNGIETPAAASTDRYTPEDDPLQRVPAAAAAAHLVFYHCDQIGTPLMMTDEAGELVWEASYRAWGEAQEVIERASAAAGIDVVRNPLRFQGQQFDDETGQHYNRYRYYDPGSSRFVNKDPIGLTGGINIYQYAPNPISWIDPLGLQRTLTGTTKGGMSRCSSGWRDRYGPASMREHHLIPQAMMNNDNFMAQMKNAGVSDPEDYIHRQIAQISNAQHIDVHEGGWNKDWQSWYQNNPNFTRKRPVQKPCSARLKMSQQMIEQPSLRNAS